MNKLILRNLKEVAELRRQIAIEHAAKHKKEKILDTDVPTEFECCFCTTKVCEPYSRSRKDFQLKKNSI